MSFVAVEMIGIPNRPEAKKKKGKEEEEEKAMMGEACQNTNGLSRK